MPTDEYDDDDRPRRAEYDDDRPARASRSGAEFPTGAKIAGIIWIAFGALGLLSNLVNIAISAGQGGAGGGPQFAGIGCGILIAAAFLFVGIQTVKGTAASMIGNGIGSLIFGVLQLTCGGVMMAGGGIIAAGGGGAPPGGGAAGSVAMIIGGITIVFGLALITAGTLALMNKSAYDEWRAAEGLGKRRRRTADERDYDDRSRRRGDEGD
jgi:hypothetical protein